MHFEYNPLSKRHKSVIGGVCEKHPVRFFVCTDAKAVKLCLFTDEGKVEQSMNKTSDGFQIELSLDRGLYFYCFIADGLRWGRNDNFFATLTENCYQLTVYPQDYTTPDWIKGGIIYQIFPDRFCKVGDFSVGSGKVKRKDWGGEPTYRSSDGKVRNNEFFGGNFKGIQSKLDYIHGLGVNAIYLNPISKSYSSHRYDTGDYTQPDPVLGTIEDFKNLTQSAKQKQIYFILDGVFNHTGAGSKYFNKYNEYDSIGAFNDKNSPYYDWYTFYSYPNEYASWWDFKTLPSIKKDSKQFQRFILEQNGVIDTWLDWGVRGVRLDVVDELKDSFVYNIRLALKNRGDNLLIGEVWEDATNKIAYGERRKYFSGGELDSVMNYPLRNAIVNFLQTANNEYLTRVVLEQINNYPKPALDCIMNILSTHDSARIITLLGATNLKTNKDEMANEKLSSLEYQRGKSREILASVLQFYLYGVPSVYYGDEAGLQGNLDPYNRRCYDWEKQDKALLNHYQMLAKIRRENRVFEAGETTVIPCEDKSLFIFTRQSENELIYLAINSGNHAKQLKFDTEFCDLYTNKKGNKFSLNGMGFLILKQI